MSSSSSSTNHGRSSSSGAPVTATATAGSPASCSMINSRSRQIKRVAGIADRQCAHVHMLAVSDQNAASTLESRFMVATVSRRAVEASAARDQVIVNVQASAQTS